MTAARLLLVAALALPAVACGSSPTSPSTTSSSSTSSTAFDVDFEATLSPGESSFYAFKTNAGQVTVTLASVVRPGQFAAVPVHLRIGLGVPAGEGCAVTESVDVMPALTPQLITSREAGIYCVSVADIGELSGTVLPTLRYRHL